MDTFTPVSALIGGAMIGLASALLWIGNGRIAGISGIFGNLIAPANTILWRIVFLAAMILAGFVTAALLPELGVGGVEPAVLLGDPVWLAVAGLLVGVGTKIGNGCTSGHGVCGIARLSPRSFVAVGVFFSVAIATVAITGVV